ncbi:MAG: pantoate--beta-alanine ligase [Chloroflexi bacterium]|nr:pantoate--beta-alanine ligase [Chloroflexota bacterium]
MQQVSTVADLRALVAAMPRPLGLVPTMGALHEGHLSLVRRAREDNKTVVATIFVNPTQFGPTEDLGRYPRPLERDLSLLAGEHIEVVYIPSTDAMYPSRFVTTVHVNGPSAGYEGDVRPEHFDGVATVVSKLLLQVLPDVAYFGRKDAQQAAVVRRLVSDLNIPVGINVMPTVREGDGLAISSRNANLTPEQRAAAPVLFRALSAARDRFRSGEQDAVALEAGCRALIASQPLIDSVDYVALVDADTFEVWDGRGPCLMIAAVRIGSVRLLDNVVLD